MARIRTIKPEFPQSESMGNVSRDARLCFVMLWTISDDAGRLRGNSRMLASLLFPYDDDAPKLIDDWLSELEQEGCIQRYAIDGASYLEITNWLSHQKIDKPSPSKLPAFDEGSRILASPREAYPLDLDLDQRTKDQGSGKREDEMPRKRDASSQVAKPDDVTDQTWNDWVALRTKKKSAVSGTAINGARKEAAIAGVSLEAFLQEWCLRGSQGMKGAWMLEDTARRHRSQARHSPMTDAERAAVVSANTERAKLMLLGPGYDGDVFDHEPIRGSHEEI